MWDAFRWLLAVEVLGALAFPLAFLLFRRLPDRGYTLARPVGLLLFSYVLWMLGLSRLIPNSLFTILGILALAATVSAWLLNRHRSEVLAFFRSQWRLALATEGLFLAIFALWIALVSQFPAINHTEKPMDFGFMNAVLASKRFPPEDPWLSGNSISYYYFGHFMMAFLTKLVATPSSVGYNLALASVPALAGVGAFGLVYNLVSLSGGSRRAALGFGLTAPALLALIGNLEGALEFVHARGWGGEGFWSWVSIKGLEGSVSPAAGPFPEGTWWWWRATRVIDTLVDGQSLDYTITEFPFFSFLLGDLHAHVVSLPFLLLALSLGLNLFHSTDRLGAGWLLRHPVEAFAVALFLGSLAFINIWDFPVFAAILGLLVLVKSYAQARGSLRIAAADTALMLAPVLLAAVVLFLPFYLDLSSQASGILPVTGPGSRPFLFLLAVGLPAVLGLSFALRQVPGLVRPAEEDGPAATLVLVVTLTPFLLWAAITFLLLSDSAAGGLATIGSRLIRTLPGMAIVSLAWFSAAQRMRLNLEPAAAFPLLLLGAAFYLLVGAELFFLKDFFGTRMNTVFKVYYQAWLLLALAGAYGLYYWRSRKPTLGAGLRLGHYAWTAIVVALALVSLYYPAGAIAERAGEGERAADSAGRTLDGLAFIRRSNAGEYAAIQWLRDRASPGRIVEAVGDDYSDYGRISSSTGLATILGWQGHELQWRGGSGAFAGRERDVALIYQSDDREEVRRLLDKYGVRYVYVGDRERAAYGNAQLDKFGSFMRTAFQQGGVIIYERANGLERGSRPNTNPDPG